MGVTVLYHANCFDGAGAALVAWRYFGNTPRCIPVQYGNPPPDIEPDTDLYILDFSYDRATIAQLAGIAKKVTVIDHHKTAREELSAPFHESNIDCVFDMTQSGAVLTRRYFHPDAPVPELLQHIQDRDLWAWTLPHTADILAGLQLFPDWRDWERFLDHPILLQSMRVDGRAINRYLRIQMERIIETPPRVFYLTGDKVPMYNLPGFMISDTLHLALEKYPEASYAVGFFGLPDLLVYSLRSRQGSDVDVSEIAKRYGGGGHKHAAGFTMTPDD